MARFVATEALHGRLDEIELLEACLDRVAGGVFQSVVVEGQAGIGKTRILQTALERARARGFQVFFGRPDELERGRSFGPLGEALGCTPEAKGPRQAAIGRLLTANADTDRTANADTDRTPIEPTSDPGLRFRVVDAFVDLVEELALAAPVALALDDLQWADPSSLLAVRSLGRRLPYLPVALLVALRPLPRPPELEQLVALLEHDGAHQLAIGPLDQDAVVALVAELVRAEPSPSMVEQLATAGGNPLFVIELVRALVEEAAIEVIGERAELLRSVLPPSLRLTILRRLRFLDTKTLEILRVASVLGSTFSVRDVATVIESATAPLVGAVSEAVRAGVLVERGDRLGFQHDLIREAIYEDLPKDVRASLHADAGRRLATAGAPAVRVAEQLALGASDDDADATVWLRRAARETAPRDPASAIRLLRRGLELLPAGARDQRNDVRSELAMLLAYTGAPAEAEALAREVLAAPRDSGLEAGLRASLIHALLAQGRWADIVSEVDSARAHPDISRGERGRLVATGALARVWLGDLDGAAADAEEAIRLGKLADDPVAVCFGLGQLANVVLQRGHVHDGLELAHEAVDVATQAGAADAVRRQAQMELGMAQVAADHLREARETLEHGRRLGERAGAAWDLPLHHVMVAMPLYYLGKWDDALAEIEAGLVLADEQGSGVGRVTALSFLGTISVRRGDLRAAEEAISAATEIVESLGPQWGMGWLTFAQAHLLDAAGDGAQALAILRTAWEAATSGGWVDSALYMGPALARAALRAGDRELVRAVAAAMEEMAKRAAVPYASGGALLSRALADADGDIALEAVEAYRASERIPEIASACEDAAHLVALEGRPAAVRDLFEEALATYERLGAARDLARALASMRALGMGRKRRGARQRPSSGWAALTPSELEVVRLAAEGLTNPEIGQRLFISRRTAQTHLAHAFRKLGVSSRVQLAAEVARRGGI